MNRKNVKEHMRKKFNEWTETITDPHVKDLVQRNSIITGGSIVSLLTDEKVNDYDVYFKNKETVLAVAKYYTEKYDSNTSAYVQVYDCAVINATDLNDLLGHIDKDRVYLYINSSGIAHYDVRIAGTNVEALYTPKVVTCNAISLTNGIQLIVRFYGSIYDIHTNFDYEHAKCSWESDANRLTLPMTAMEAILTKQLIYTGSKYPVSSVIRTRKFIKRGWYITGGEYIKMLFQVSQLDLMDINVLADQLVGVDTSYFYELISRLKYEMTEGNDALLYSDRIIKIVDEIFNE